MHGNVWEWVEDCWNESYAGAPSDGTAWLSGNCGLRVLRGGSWNLNPGNLRSANRYWNATDDRNVSDGFRVARTLD
jgi:formylglycine-generating enzyme required for sulfatase activity